MPDILTHFGLAHPRQICIVGDRVTTDVVMGNQHGSFTILVAPLDPSKDNVVVRTVRSFEDRWLVKLVGDVPPKHESN
jgi:predicted HAD superfamily phosphohydrolase YqeG